MYNTAIVVFREILEIAIILGVIMAATKGVAGRTKYAIYGVGLGIIGSVLVAIFADSISNFAEGMGQELFNAIILLAAAFMIGWTVVWMRAHAKDLIAKVKQLGANVANGNAPMYSLSIAIALATLREGSEIVLFTYANILSGVAITDILLGAVIGFTGGSAIGFLLYFGLIKISTKYIFRVTTWLLILLSAGLASYAAGLLVAAGYFESYSQILWDSSGFISNQSMLGEILSILIGYTANPMLIQLVFYTLTLGIIIIFLRATGKSINKNLVATAN